MQYKKACSEQEEKENQTLILTLLFTPTFACLDKPAFVKYILEYIYSSYCYNHLVIAFNT